ncbi:hypothetical protein BDF14DRAFT_1796773 [Spinellus fusiger]|nr:hypothetical protein BDF14DRAFT_1796773 [Spinellus fusiger]
MHLVALILILWATLAHAATIKGAIKKDSRLPTSTLLRTNTRVTLNGQAYTTLVDISGEFVLHNVAPGSYLLEIHSIDYIFPKLRVDVTENTVQAAYTVTGGAWDTRGALMQHPLEIRSLAKADYFIEKQNFQIMGILKNPMFLMLGFSGLIMFVMPKMMKSLDPEAMKEMAESQAEAQKMLSDMPSLSKMFSQGQEATSSRR